MKYLTNLLTRCICISNGLKNPEITSGGLLVRSSTIRNSKTVEYCLSSLLAGMRLSVRTSACSSGQVLNIPASFFALKKANSRLKLFTARRSI